jgi:hypothetical protein
MTVSRVAQELDEKLSQFRGRRRRRLEAQEYPYLKIDARYEKVRVDGKVISQAVLVVAGFTGTGRREILDWRVADSESERFWSEVLMGLKNRGLKGVELIVSDAHSGIRAAIGPALPRRCLGNAAWATLPGALQTRDVRQGVLQAAQGVDERAPGRAGGVGETGVSSTRRRDGLQVGEAFCARGENAA